MFEKLVLRALWLIMIRKATSAGDQMSTEIRWAQDMESYLNSMEE